MRYLVPLLAVVTVPQIAAAHDLWLQPERFISAAGVTLPVTIEVGHGTARQRWGVATRRVLAFYTVGPEGSTDRRAGLRTDRGDADAAIRFATPGTHVIALVTSHATSELPAIRFNDYATVEGLTPILAWRARARAITAIGREIYSRRAKALVQVGPPGSAQPHVVRPLGMTLEIVPERNPYQLKDGQSLPVRVLYEGRPLAGALVKLTDLDRDAAPVAEHRTDPDGRAAFALAGGSKAGGSKWQMNVVWSKPIDDPRGDFDTTFSSLTFASPPAGPPR